VTVLESIQKSAEFLVPKGVDSPRLQAELLLAHVLKLPRMQLYLNFSRVLTPAEVDSLRELVKRRGRREPLQHIVGTTSFCGLEIAVNRHVLVPRPETELLAEQGWQFLNRRAEGPAARPAPPGEEREEPGAGVMAASGEGPSSARPPALLALDWGTGSGCLAIALAAKCAAAQVCALDISPEALVLARENAARHRLAERIRFFEGSGFAAVPADLRCDLIVSNPPYIPTAEIDTLQPEVREHDPRGALDGGSDGLEWYRRLAAEAGAFLQQGGRLMLELGDGQADRVAELFRQQKWIVEAVIEDYNHEPRILIGRQ
jgi:release factor glutamine methyltransferase